MKRVNFGTYLNIINIAIKLVFTYTFRFIYIFLIKLCMNRICNRYWLLKFKIKVKLIT